MLIHNAIQNVAADRRRWRACDHIRSGYFSYSVGSHVLFFTPREGGIVIVRVLHQSMDFNRHF
ncbi:type II toxin-antitoxin system RelE/ParE family toxin [Xanthobacteraceae bacterium Astr-EGSB]|uniref:type II toxin-antitoxin system RelE/ParE family toxin n=1 Tax=Astrobacterium formosum TaxID=3069710 RepID=UPI0027B40BB0|nr:type II toxin-antitoxin system RelE/ParE family toxin [Xanthobacteraceae bacterium Astr-EGSB]